MHKNSILSGLLFLLCVSAFGFEVRAQEAAAKSVPPADQVQIIKILLEEKFGRSWREPVVISSKNLSDEVQSGFPKIKNLKVQFLSPEDAAGSKVCFYEFSEFIQKEEFVIVSFGNCQEGLSYTLKKYGDKWKTLLLSIERSDAP